MADLLRIAVTFASGYAGADERTPEEVPSPARVYEAFVAAAAGGPWAVASGEVLVATVEFRAAVGWLEEHEPLGVSIPQLRLAAPEATRYRRRASPVTLNGTTFESRCAMDGPVTYFWTAPEFDTVQRLQQVAHEVTHVGRGDSLALVRVDTGPAEHVHGSYHRRVPRRGPGRVLRIPIHGRFRALEEAHRDASRPSGYGVGSLGRQAADVPSQRASSSTTVLRRFAPAASDAPWPYEEVWTLRHDRHVDVRHRVVFAGRVHRALVAAIGDDVPPFVTGRSGGGPLRGNGHLAIQVRQEADTGCDVLLAIPRGVPEADRARLATAVSDGLRRREVRLQAPAASGLRDARSYWGTPGSVMRTVVPIVLDAPGTPRRAPWTLSDSVVCSVGYALRGILALEWGAGWAFRRALVDYLRHQHGVDALVQRAHEPVSRYVHRAQDGDLLVAVRAEVDLGKLAAPGGGLLALGRARHMGGGLLRPVVAR